MIDFKYQQPQMIFCNSTLSVLSCEIRLRKHSSTRNALNYVKTIHFLQYLKVPIAPNYKGVCLQHTSKPHSCHFKIW